jgi:pimeloyl-ACP methyl ester carboxylesterase
MTLMKFSSVIVTVTLSACMSLTQAQAVHAATLQPGPVAARVSDETVDLNNQIRASEGSSYIALSDGVVAYRLTERGGPKLAVLIHGYSAPSFVWGGIARQLNAAGISTLTYDLFGHGLSDRPLTTYNRDLFNRQLDELLARLAPDRRLLLVGWSMGAMIATRFASEHRNRVDSVFLVSPSGLPIQAGWSGRIAMIPVLGDIGFRLLGGWGIRNAQREFFVDPQSLEAYMREFEPQMQYAGFQRAMLSTLRHMDMDDFSAGYQHFGKAGIPTTVVWATQDRATPFTNSALFMKLVPHAVLKPLEGMGHASLYENPDRVYQSLFGQQAGN